MRLLSFERLYLFIVLTHCACSGIGHVEIPEWKAKAVNLGKIQRFTKKELESYSDLLAPYLLNDYGVLNDSDWEDEEDNVTNLSSKCIDKVQSWLSTGDNVHSEITDEDDLNEFALDAQNFDSEKDTREIDNTSLLSKYHYVFFIPLMIFIFLKN